MNIDVNLPTLQESYFQFLILSGIGLTTLLSLLIIYLLISSKKEKRPTLDQLPEYLAKIAETFGDQELKAVLDTFNVARVTNTMGEYMLYNFKYVDNYIAPYNEEIKKSVNDIKSKIAPQNTLKIESAEIGEY